MRSKKPHWTKKVPIEPGLYWYRIADVAVGGVTDNAGKEFTFIGTDAAAGPKELRSEGMEFWSERLTAPEEEE